MGERGAGARFMPNRLVFPGGAVDPGEVADRPQRPGVPLTAGQLSGGELVLDSGQRRHIEGSPGACHERSVPAGSDKNGLLSGGADVC